MSDGKLNLNILKDEGRVELLELLESLRGRKCLVLDGQLADILNHVILDGSKALKEQGVTQMKELSGDLDFSSESGKDIPDNIVYLLRPNLSLMKLVAKQVKACLTAGVYLISMLKTILRVSQAFGVNIIYILFLIELLHVSKSSKMRGYSSTLKLVNTTLALSLWTQICSPWKWNLSSNW